MAEKQMEMPREKGKKLQLRIIAVGFITAFAVFLALIFLEKSILNQEKVISCVTAAKEIPDKTNLTRENAAEYLTVSEFRESQVPADALLSVEQAIGFTAMRPISEKEWLTPNSLRNTEEYIGKLDAPVELSVKADTADCIVAGTIRAGDKVNIYKVREDPYQEDSYYSQLILGDVYVSGAYDSSANVLQRGSEGAAVILNLLIDAEQEAALTGELRSGSGKISINLIR